MKDINDLIIDENYIDYKEDFEILSEWTVDPKKKEKLVSDAVSKLQKAISSDSELSRFIKIYTAKQITTANKRIFILEKRNIMKLRNVNCLLDIITLVAYQSIKNFIQNSKVLLLM